MEIKNVSNFYASGIASAGAKQEMKSAPQAVGEEKEHEIKDDVQLHQKDETSAPAKKKWTVLAYINGKDGNLQRTAPSVMRELEQAGTDENMNIAAQLSRKGWIVDKWSKDWEGTKRYEVQRNPDPPPLQEEMMNLFLPPYTKNIVSPVIQDMGKVNMGDKATFQDFLEWGIKKYPAEHYAVLIYGQGGGFAGALADEEFKDVLTNKELSEGLKSASDLAGQKIDLVAFDGNLMSQIEVADTLKDSANIMVASQGTVNLGSLPLDGVMKDLKFELADSGKVTPEELAKFFVFEQKYQPGPSAEMMAPTLSAIDLRKMDDLKGAFNEFTKEIAHSLEKRPELKEALREVIGNTQAFVPKGGAEPYTDYKDIGHFTKLVLSDDRFNNYYFPEIKPKGEALLKSIQGSLIDEAHIGKAVENATGLSAYMPTDFGHDMPSTFFQPENWDPTHGYGDLSIAKDTVWDEVLSTIAKDTKFHEFLRNKLGLSDNVINKTDKILGTGKKASKFALGLASNAGYYESYRAMRGKPPEDFMKIVPGSIAAKAGIVGGVRSAYLGADQAIDAIKDKELKNRTTAIVDGAADTVSGAAVTAACIGMSFAKAAAIATPAGYVSVAVPIAKTVYDMYSNFKQQAAAKAEWEAKGMTPGEKLATLEADKMKAQTEQGKTYISPIVHFLTHAYSSGPIDPGMIQQG